MAVVTARIELETGGGGEAIDVTAEVRRALADSGLADGLCTVFVPGATGGVTTVEYEPGLVEDLRDLWERIAPAERDYAHNRAWGDGNGHSHVRASLLGPGLSVPFAGGELLLGTWQQIIFVDFDNRPRSRRLVVQCMGECS